MKPTLIAALAALSLSALSAPAHADHLGYGGAVDHWTGFYAGASIGYGFADTDFTHTFDNGAVTAVTQSGISGDGVTGTLAIGYDVNFSSNIVAGVFADYTFGELDGSGVYALNVVAPYNIEYDDTWAIGGRVGLARPGGTLWYLTAGYTETDFTLSDPFGTLKRDLSGYFLGGGVEQSLNHHGLFLKLEYRYSDYGSERVFDQAAGCCSESYDIDTDIHAVRLGISYKFGHREPAPAMPLK